VPGDPGNTDATGDERGRDSRAGAAAGRIEDSTAVEPVVLADDEE